MNNPQLTKNRKFLNICLTSLVLTLIGAVYFSGNFPPSFAANESDDDDYGEGRVTRVRTEPDGNVIMFITLATNFCNKSKGDYIRIVSDSTNEVYLNSAMSVGIAGKITGIVVEFYAQTTLNSNNFKDCDKDAGRFVFSRIGLGTDG